MSRKVAILSALLHVLLLSEAIPDVDGIMHSLDINIDFNARVRNNAGEP